MYAIVETGGRQFRVAPEEKLRIPRLTAAVGEDVEFDRVLLVGGGSQLSVGKPLVEGARVVAEVIAHDREEKIIVFHKKRRKRYQKKRGHRQPCTDILIKDIVA
ncbi:MAG: 50S ribosomal protein L21 [Gemmatimonadota bacterium]|nr:50S ribosomal protein L21 [Gemmatimonadota bacterium]MDP6528091.1 50S ribosomal protein L21 [Gemmatimonadota bacterium]MDP6802285.1 50S ribosomal protein L21 [Gemmatimonadota bacterium]MDP7031981.1 50S ribosomal protein L21 [Gemmatimonadota bacterium]